MQNKSYLLGRLDVKAFTLIELLVVVLIIGILAAVALPQYQKAVEKSRGTQALTLMGAFAQALSAYYMANGSYPTSFEELDLDVSAGWTGNEKWSTLPNIIDSKSNGEWSLQMYKTEATGGLLLQIGRLTGKYQGAGFVRVIAQDGQLLDTSIICAERKTSGVIFTEPDGSYCHGIWKATFNGDNSKTYRAYRMP